MVRVTLSDVWGNAVALSADLTATQLVGSRTGHVLRLSAMRQERGAGGVGMLLYTGTTVADVYDVVVVVDGLAVPRRPQLAVTASTAAVRRYPQPCPGSSLGSQMNRASYGLLPRTLVLTRYGVWGDGRRMRPRWWQLRCSQQWQENHFPSPSLPTTHTATLCCQLRAWRHPCWRRQSWWMGQRTGCWGGGHTHRST